MSEETLNTLKDIAQQMVGGTWPRTWDYARLLEGEIERRGLQDKYLHALSDMLDADVWEPGDVQVVSADALWLLIRATPEQRARAFLHVVEEG